jgi:hypothetical protein
MSLLRTFFLSALEFAFAVPAILLAFWNSPARRWRWVLAVVGIFVVDEFLLHSPRASVFAHLKWNWQGKLLELVWALVVIALSRITIREVGLGRPTRDWVKPTLVVLMALLCLPLFFLLAFGARESLTAEGWLFQLTIPGLAEEILYRGVIQSFLNRAFGKPWSVFGTRIGWGWVITSLLFMGVHVVWVDKSLHPQFIWADGLGPLVGSLLGGWLRERTESVWPIVVGHNLSNVVIAALSLR